MNLYSIVGVWSGEEKVYSNYFFLYFFSITSGKVSRVNGIRGRPEKSYESSVVSPGIADSLCLYIVTFSSCNSVHHDNAEDRTLNTVVVFHVKIKY